MTPADSATAIVVNAGSSSLKVTALGAGDAIDAAFHLDHWDGSPVHAGLTDFLSRAGRDAIVTGHRVVHGGGRFSEAVLIDDSVTAAIRDLTDLAPLHQPRALAGIAAA